MYKMPYFSLWRAAASSLLNCTSCSLRTDPEPLVVRSTVSSCIRTATPSAVKLTSSSTPDAPCLLAYNNNKRQLLWISNCQISNKNTIVIVQWSIKTYIKIHKSTSRITISLSQRTSRTDKSLEICSPYARSYCILHDFLTTFLVEINDKLFSWQRQ